MNRPLINVPRTMLYYRICLHSIYVVLETIHKRFSMSVCVWVGGCACTLMVSRGLCLCCAHGSQRRMLPGVLLCFAPVYLSLKDRVFHRTWN